jgi:hypothetical protein
MVLTTRPGIYDPTSDKMVYYWQDYYFDTYIASSRWSYRLKLN